MFFHLLFTLCHISKTEMIMSEDSFFFLIEFELRPNHARNDTAIIIIIIHLCTMKMSKLNVNTLPSLTNGSRIPWPLELMSTNSR